MWTTWFCHSKCSVPVEGEDLESMTNGPKLQVIESVRRINYHFPQASWMVIFSHCLICDSRCSILHSGCQTSHKPRRGSTWSIHPVCQGFESFLCLFVPLITFFGWVKSLLLWAQEQRMWCEHPRRTFYFIFIIFCDDFIIPLGLTFPHHCFSPFLFLQHPLLWFLRLFIPAA